MNPKTGSHKRRFLLKGRFWGFKLICKSVLGTHSSGHFAFDFLLKPSQKPKGVPYVEKHPCGLLFLAKVKGPLQTVVSHPEFSNLGFHAILTRRAYHLKVDTGSSKVDSKGRSPPQCTTAMSTPEGVPSIRMRP